MSSSARILLDEPSDLGRRAGPQRLAISDVHGHVDALSGCLEKHGLIDAEGNWVGGTTRLWFLGDYLDRGRHGLEVIDLVTHLERGAADSGGFVRPLLGNHELQFLAAMHFGDQHLTSDGRTTWRAGWLRYGGVPEELQAVDDATVEWITGLPLADLDGDDLFLHSDTDAYLELGATVEEINAAGREILAGRDADAWAALHRIMVKRHGFRESGSAGAMLSKLGARRVVHGHNSLIGGFGLSVSEAGNPHVYASGAAVAIDGGVFEGGSLVVADL